MPRTHDCPAGCFDCSGFCFCVCHGEKLASDRIYEINADVMEAFNQVFDRVYLKTAIPQDLMNGLIFKGTGEIKFCEFLHSKGYVITQNGWDYDCLMPSFNNRRIGRELKGKK